MKTTTRKMKTKAKTATKPKNNDRINTETITTKKINKENNKSRYMATEVACGWTGAIFAVTRPFGQKQ